MIGEHRGRPRALAGAAEDPRRDEDREEREHEDQVPRLRGGVAADPRGEEGRDGDADDAEGEDACLRAHADQADESEHEDDDEHGPLAAAEVAGRSPQVGEDRGRAAELVAAASHPDVEPSCEHEVCEPERDADDGHGRKGGDGLPQTVATRGDDEHALRGQYERSVRVRRDGEEDRRAPEHPRPRGAAIEGAEEEHEREQREEEEEAVHPRVDGVEEEDPATGDECCRDQRCPLVREPPPEKRDERKAPGGEGRGDETEAAEPAAEMGDRVGEQEVQGRPSTLAGDVLDHAAEGVAADEERERLVLVRRPRHQLVEQERARRYRDRDDAEPEAVRDNERPRREESGTRFPGGLDALCHRA